MLIVNSPSNPLGAVYDRETLTELLAFASRHDLWVISDEVYERFVWDTEHVSMASLDTENRVLSVFSLSKTYAMTGVRVGYLVVPPGLALIMRTLQEASISCVAAPDQYAALAAIEGDQSHVDAAREHYRANFEAVARVLDDRGIRYLRPRGTLLPVGGCRARLGRGRRGLGRAVPAIRAGRGRSRKRVRTLGRGLDPHLPRRDPGRCAAPASDGSPVPSRRDP